MMRLDDDFVDKEDSALVVVAFCCWSVEAKEVYSSSRSSCGL